MEFSKTQVDRLGERLKTGLPSPSDLEALNQYRLSYGNAYKEVAETLRQRFQLSPTGRPAKSTSSIIDKLRRESIRLSQIQDIAGCRVVVTDIAEQERITPFICSAFSKAHIVDRRAKPSNGYRAIHVIVEISGKLIEIQIRSVLQHLWAELSEKLSDSDPKIKYGGGNDAFKNFLKSYSELVIGTEKNEIDMLSVENKLDVENKKRIKDAIVVLKKKTADLLNKALTVISKEKLQ